MNEHAHSEGSSSEDAMNDLLLAMDVEYVVHEPRPKHLNVIFEQLRDAQIYFATEVRYTTPEAAAHDGQRYADSMTEYLAQLPEMDKVIGEPASLTGAGIYPSHMTINYLTGDMTVSPSMPADEQGVFEAQTEDTFGLFRGVTVLVGIADGLEGADSQNTLAEGSYYIRLFYQIETGAIRHPFGQNAAYTLGEIGITTLTFEEDAEREVVHEALTQLLSNDSLEVAMLVNELNRALTSPKHSAKQIRKIGDLVQRLHACDALRFEDSEAILSLIAAYIPPQAAYEIHVADALEYETDATSGKVSRSLVKAADGTPIEFEQFISNIILSPGYDPDVNLENPTVLQARGVAAYFVLEREGLVYHLPMQRVVAFGDVS